MEASAASVYRVSCPGRLSTVERDYGRVYANPELVAGEEVVLSAYRRLGDGENVAERDGTVLVHAIRGGRSCLARSTLDVLEPYPACGHGGMETVPGRWIGDRKIGFLVFYGVPTLDGCAIETAAVMAESRTISPLAPMRHAKPLIGEGFNAADCCADGCFRWRCGWHGQRSAAGWMPVERALRRAYTAATMVYWSVVHAAGASLREEDAAQYALQCGHAVGDLLLARTRQGRAWRYTSQDILDVAALDGAARPSLRWLSVIHSNTTHLTHAHNLAHTLNSAALSPAPSFSFAGKN